MDLKNKNVLVIGLAKTGISTLKYLNKQGANIKVHDIKSENELNDVLKSLNEIKDIEYILGREIDNFLNIDLVVVSPGVPLDTPLFKKIKSLHIEIIGDVELAYRASKEPQIIGITGTNGKTTTTSLVGSIMNTMKKDTFVVGNIGNPIIETIGKANKESFLVAELSSFQLESIKEFKPKVSVILNITEDHLNRHKTMENYILAKSNIFKNQTSEDITILNYDDEIVRMLYKNTNGKVLFFSRKEKLDNGICLDENDNVVIVEDGVKNIIINKNDIKLPGNHNLENAMAAIAVFYSLKLNMDIVCEVLKMFDGVEHRQEYVCKVNDISFINDSKATNPDSTIKALESYNQPITLIAGGMDKGNDFYDVIDVINKNKVKAVVLLGETSNKIKEQLSKMNFKGIINKTENMKEAVLKSYEISDKGDIVLLSPACASWDMYKNFEERGKDFKNNVLKLK